MLLTSTEWWCFRHPKKSAALLREREYLIREITAALAEKQASSFGHTSLSTLLHMREEVRSVGFTAGIAAARRKDAKDLD